MLSVCLWRQGEVLDCDDGVRCCVEVLELPGLSYRSSIENGTCVSIKQSTVAYSLLVIEILIESFLRFKGHSMTLLMISVGAGGCTMPYSRSAVLWASIASVTSLLAPIMLSIDI